MNIQHQLFFALLLLFSTQVVSQDNKLDSVKSFAFALGVPLTQENVHHLKSYDIVILDGENTTQEVITELREANVIVLAYLSVGTIERGRSWFRAARRYRLAFWPDWEEWYANIRASGFRRLILNRVIPSIISKSFHGLFLDNLDVFESFPEQRSGTFKLLSSIREQLNQSSKLLAAQNAGSAIEQLAPLIDFWNLEDVSTGYNFERQRYYFKSANSRNRNIKLLQMAASLGLKVAATDYVGIRTRPDKLALVKHSACLAGALPFYSDVYLKRLPAQPLRCE